MAAAWTGARLEHAQCAQLNQMATDPLYLNLKLNTTGLSQDVTFSVIYTSDATNQATDQELERIDMGPVKNGIFEFCIAAAAPLVQNVAPEHLFDSTIIYVCCIYKGEEFARSGWYVRHGYPEGTDLPPGGELQLDKLARYVQEDYPTISHYNVAFDNAGEMFAQAEYQHPEQYAGHGYTTDQSMSSSLPPSAEPSSEMTDEQPSKRQRQA